MWCLKLSTQFFFIRSLHILMRGTRRTAGSPRKLAFSSKISLQRMLKVVSFPINQVPSSSIIIQEKWALWLLPSSPSSSPEESVSSASFPNLVEKRKANYCQFFMRPLNQKCTKANKLEKESATINIFCTRFPYLPVIAVEIFQGWYHIKYFSSVVFYRCYFAVK